jgi:hypothetical protein
MTGFERCRACMNGRCGDCQPDGCHCTTPAHFGIRTQPGWNRDHTRHLWERRDDRGQPTGETYPDVYHGPWNLFAHPQVPWLCTLHGLVEGAVCKGCFDEAAEHERECGPSMACVAWRAAADAIR